MFRTLASKEFSEHGWMLLIILPLAGLGFLVQLAGAAFNEMGSHLVALTFFCYSWLPLLIMVVCNRLVVQEYSKKTQLFLEGLPVSRSGMVLTKYALGLTIILTTVICCVAIAAAVSSRQEPINSQFLLIILSRVTAFAFAVFSFFFMMGFLGRYRIAIFVAMIVLIPLYLSSSSFDLESMGPFRLIDRRLAFERVELPTTDLLITLAIGTVFSATAFVLASLREGTVAGMLAERMSYREKVFVAVTIFCFGFLAYVLDERKKPEPYEILYAIEFGNEQFRVQVEPGLDTESAEQLANDAYEDLQRVVDHLTLPTPPDIFIVQRGDLDPDKYEPAKLINADGFLMRANFSSDDWSYESFRPYLIDVFLSEATNYVAVHEDRCWVLEGFSQYWPRREKFNSDWDSKCKSDLRAAYAASLGLNTNDLAEWYRLRDRLGQPILRSLGCSGLVIAEHKYGREKVDLFLREILGGNQPKDFRSDMSLWLNPISSVWRNIFGEDYEAFKKHWIEQLDDLSSKWDSELSQVPKVEMLVSLSAKSDESFEANAKPRIEPSPRDGEVEILFEELEAFDTWEHDRTATSQIEEYRDGMTVSMSQFFSRGSRVRWTAKVRSEALGCDVISGWERRDIQ